MIIKLSRKETIRAIQLHRLLYLPIEEKGNILLSEGLEGIGDEDEGWNEEEISNYENNSLIMGQFQLGNLVTNEYLQLLMDNLYKREIEIIDKQPILEGVIRCVCCEFKIAFEKEDIDICPVCNWQDVYIESEDKYSSANYSSLKDYRETFNKIYAENSHDLKYKKFSK
jgi:Zn finger protein HypA/HybF involved in hydrogenase expression